jgi:DNA-binding CsgD family transcriptional regulator/tetratricopeptide (TPR) repeat protein
MSANASDALQRARGELAAYRWTEALAAFDAVLADGEDPDARFGRGVAAWWLDRMSEAIRDWERAYVIHRRRGELEPAVIAAVYVALASSMSLGNLAMARGWTARAERLVRDHDLQTVGGWVALCQAHSAIDGGHPDAGHRFAAEALDAARTVGDADLELCLVAEIGMALVELGKAEEGGRYLEEAMAGAMGGEARDPDSVVLISCRSITASTRAGDVQRATKWIGQADAFYERIGSTHLYTTCRLEYGNLLFATGQWGRAEAELVAARRAVVAVEPAVQDAATATLAELRVAQGRLDEASRLVATLEDVPSAVRAIALVRLRRGEPSPAASILRRRLRQIDDDTLEASSLLDLLGEAESAVGRFDAVRSVGERLLGLGERSANETILGRAYRTWGRAALGIRADTDAIEQFERAITLFGRVGLPYQAAVTRALLAHAASDVDRDLAVAEGRIALRAFEDLGAARDADATSALLRSLGVRPSPRGARAVGTLTPREREVLGLLGEGLSNREIGDRLFITRKTVEHHVASVLDKLGLSGRSEAAAFAVRASAEEQTAK